MSYVKQTWVDQEGQVRYTETTDGDYKIFTPNYEEVTTMGTPVNAVNMNHIEGGIEYCDANMVKRKSTSQATGGSTQPVYVKADGVVETCNIDVSNSRFDGQWVNDLKTLSTATTPSTYEIDLSDYLPDDNYIYEVSIYCRFHQTTSSGATVQFYSSIFNSGINYSDAIGMACANTNSTQAGVYLIIPIPSDRKLYFRIGLGKLDNYGTFAFGYRRIGTNL